MALFEIENLTYFYPEAERPALDGLTLGIEEGGLTLVTGPSGGGKTTLARALAGLVPEFFGGKIGGTVRYMDKPLRELDSRSLHREIGVVLQDPERQLLMTTVERELAFGPENSGMPPELIKRRVMESASCLGITGLLDRRTAELSGGMQQKVILGAAIAMEPRILILDEPTSQLDPVSAKELLELLVRLRDDCGRTIVLIEQRLEQSLPASDRVIFLETGKIKFDGTPRDYCRKINASDPRFLPPVTRLFSRDCAQDPPLTIRDGRRVLRARGRPAALTVTPPVEHNGRLCEIKNASYTYENGIRALRAINLAVSRGEIVSVLGPNGAGKSTLLKVISGLLRPSRGKVSVAGGEPYGSPNREKAVRCGYLSQNPDDFLFHDTVSEEIGYTLRNLGLPERDAVSRSLSLWGITRLAGRNPRELSAGERQCVALAAATIAAPPILLLDEPSRGLDARLKDLLGKLITAYVRKRDAAAIIVTQDIEFAAEWAGRAVLLFKGEVVADGPKREIFKGEPFYSSQMSRLFHNIAEGIVTLDDAREALDGAFYFASVNNCPPSDLPDLRQDKM